MGKGAAFEEVEKPLFALTDLRAGLVFDLDYLSPIDIPHPIDIDHINPRLANPHNIQYID